MSSTKDWYYHLMINLFSLLECTKNIKKIYLLLETENIDDVPYLKNIISKYNNVEISLINIKILIKKYLTKKYNNNTFLGNFSYGKLILADIIPEDKVLFIDIETIVRKDISNVWNYDITNYYVAGVKDYGVLEDGILEKYNITGKYINSGFVIFNLLKIRKNNIIQKWFSLINTKKLLHYDQDALNIICQHKELYLPATYNYCYNLTLDIHNTNSIKVFHYIASKETWVIQNFNSEEWYEAYEKFYNTFNNNTDKLIIAMSCTKDWYYYLIVNLYSLLECTKNIAKIYLLLETNKIEEVPYLEDIIKKYKINIKLINLNEQLLKDLDKKCPNLNTVYSNFSFARLMLPDLIDEDKVLYIDTDTIVRRDISNVWNYDITNYYIAGVKDYGILEDGIIEKYNITGKYVNSGFVVFNLAKIRKDHIKEKWFNIINTKKLLFPDQDALNIVCQHNELYLPSFYNVCHLVTLELSNNNLAKLYHFAGVKYDWVVNHYYSEEWYEEEEEFYNKFLKHNKE